MRCYYVFIKGIREQIRDYWILVMILVMAPLFIAIYFLMVETENPEYRVVLVNQDRGMEVQGEKVNLGDSLLQLGELVSNFPELYMMKVSSAVNREKGIGMLRNRQADVLVVLPEDFTRGVYPSHREEDLQPCVELLGDLTQMEYILGAIWSEEMINRFDSTS